MSCLRAVVSTPAILKTIVNSIVNDILVESRMTALRGLEMPEMKRERVREDGAMDMALTRLREMIVCGVLLPEIGRASCRERVL